jgi:type I restriction enzyme S subunit
VKAGWKLQRLGDLCAFDKSQGIHTNLPYVGLEHIESDTGQYLGNLEPTDVKSSTFKFNDSHVLYGRLRPYLNKVLLPDFEGHCSTEIFPIQIKPGLLREYLGHWLMSESVVESINTTCTGARMPRADMNAVLEFNIPVPSEQEQRRIVTLLDEAFADIATAKANAEKNLQNAREFFDNALQSLVDGTSNDWAQRTMAEVCDITSKLVDPREDHYLDLPHVGAGNIESKTSALVDVKTAREENLISGKFLFDESMVLYSKIRPYLMKVVRPDFNGLCSADIYPLAPKPDIITRDYLYYLLLAPTFTEYAIKGSARAGMPKVNREHLFAYQFALPKLQDQKRIAENLDQIANETIRLESVYRQKLTTLDDLKKSLLHQAFSGQL